MNYRMSSLLAVKGNVGSATETIDINLLDPISEIVIQANPYTDNSSTAPPAHPISVLDKVEIVDGSDVLMSLDGYQLHALEIYNRDRQRHPWYMYLDGNRMEIPVGINFGRYLWDEQLAFDPTKFNNPQLKISTVETSGDNQFEDIDLKVDALVFDEKSIAPEGFLMAKELKEYALGDETHEYTTMPTDYVYRKMFVQAHYAGKEPANLIDTMKLSENHDKKIPFNGMSFRDIQEAIAYMHPPIAEGLYQWCGTASTAGYCTPTDRVVGNANEWIAGAPSNIMGFYNGDGGQFNVRSHSTNCNINVQVQGYLPHGVYEIPFGDPMKIEDWYDVSKINSLLLDIFSADDSNARACKIFLEQLRPY